MNVKRTRPDRFNVKDSDEVECWAHKLGATRDQLEHVVAKIGNFAAAVRKELAR